jgi:hypothetical protein
MNVGRNNAQCANAAALSVHAAPPGARLEQRQLGVVRGGAPPGAEGGLAVRAPHRRKRCNRRLVALVRRRAARRRPRRGPRGTRRRHLQRRRQRGTKAVQRARPYMVLHFRVQPGSGGSGAPRARRAPPRRMSPPRRAGGSAPRTRAPRRQCLSKGRCRRRAAPAPCPSPCCKPESLQACKPAVGSRESATDERGWAQTERPPTCTAEIRQQLLVLCRAASASLAT